MNVITQTRKGSPSKRKHLHKRGSLQISLTKSGPKEKNKGEMKKLGNNKKCRRHHFYNDDHQNLHFGFTIELFHLWSQTIWK